MNRKLIYTLSLIGFFLTWGVFGFAAGRPRSKPVLQATLPPIENTLIAPGATESAAIPVTGETQRNTEVLLIYGVFGLGALFLILALLNMANKLTVTGVPPKAPQDEA
jgi:hypothetical protein